MKKPLQIILAVLILAFISQSCFKEDEKVPPYNPGDLETMTTNVGDTYPQQVYFDFSSKENVAIHDNISWDLAFDCREDSWFVTLNSSLMMWAGNTYDTNFALINSAEGVDMLFDVSSGNTDSTAMGIWYEVVDEVMLSKKQVYIINRGIDDVANELGFRKITIDVLEGKYLLRYAHLDGTDEQTILIEKNPNYNYKHFSFDTGLVTIEPPKEEWSLKFSRYSTVLFTDEGDPYPYNVIGVLLNPHLMTANVNPDDFSNITLQDTIQYTFSKNADIIGYNWKYYDFDDAVYSIVENRNYIVKDYTGLYYKLRFVRFYDDQGRKGSISYEFLRL